MSKQMTLRLTVNNIDKLMAVRTPEFVLQNFHWDLTVFKYSGGLDIRLSGKNGSNQTPHNVKIDFKMQSSVGGVQNIEKGCNMQLRHRQCSNIVPIISWEELIKNENGFVVNNSVQFEVKVEVKVNKPEEGEPNAKKRCTANSPEAEANALTLECAICLNKIKGQDLSSTYCGHLFCTKCITNAVQAHKRCPSCNTDLDLNKLHRFYLPIVDKD
ncbi:uncharacterized protein LOC129567269 [Sitodiplosis mosellana]|uniref:uncharacterized protein LOC129567269 n=1 Tax=Sitodiplosis mosellana TaxID=263140 RepID=UPI002443B70D|nr:uncharacterized protein LOC129567269 [Sitodiplosis mosellana]